MDALIAATTSVLAAAYAADEPVFRSRRTYPKRRLFFELEQLLKVFFPAFFVPPAHADQAHTALHLTKLVDHVRSAVAAYNDDALADRVAAAVVRALPAVRDLLKTDAIAAYAGDPAAAGFPLIIRCYPGFHASVVYRVAHVIYAEGERYYAREVMEALHGLTGIDIHPGAVIGSHFFIDHGVGVVIGETCVVGRWCRLYQSVTLGAMHFEEDGPVLKRGVKRHPTIGDGVTIGSGAKVLGNITVGSHTAIGANCWISRDVEPLSLVYISEHPTHAVKRCRSCAAERVDADIVAAALRAARSPVPDD